MHENQQKQQFHQWLFLYVNGRLGETERDWMTKYIAAHPEARAEVQIEHALRENLREELPIFAQDEGLAQFMIRLHAETNASKKMTFLASLQAFSHRLQETLSHYSITPAWAVTATLLIAQAGVIGVLLLNPAMREVSGSNSVEWRSVGEKAITQGPVLQITFKPTATEEEIRLLLVKISGSIVGGPGQLGNYFIKVPNGNLEAAEKQVRTSSIVESAQILEEIPLDR